VHAINPEGFSPEVSRERLLMENLGKGNVQDCMKAANPMSYRVYIFRTEQMDVS